MPNLSKFIERFKKPALSVSPAEVRGIMFHLCLLAALAASVYALIGIGYDLLSMRLLPVNVSGSTLKVSGRSDSFRREPADFYAVIAQRNLFGTTDKALTANKQPTAVAGPDLSTLLVIRGTVAEAGNNGFAVIEEKGKHKQMLYTVGNTVAGAKLIGIARNQVTFLFNGRQKVLKMILVPGKPPLRSSSATSAIAYANPASRPMVINRSEVDAQLRNMGTLLSQALIRPYYANGAPQGFLITNIKPGSVYQQVGLRNGDIIEGANNRKITTADDVMSFYNDMRSDSSITLKIKRGGREENLQYLLR